MNAVTVKEVYNTKLLLDKIFNGYFKNIPLKEPEEPKQILIVAYCTAIPIIEDEPDYNGYTLDKTYVFECDFGFENCFKTVGDDGMRHSMPRDYFDLYFKRIITDSRGFYVK